jgi:hypothetical protein
LEENDQVAASNFVPNSLENRGLARIKVFKADRRPACIENDLLDDPAGSL